MELSTHQALWRQPSVPSPHPGLVLTTHPATMAQSLSNNPYIPSNPTPRADEPTSISTSKLVHLPVPNRTFPSPHYFTAPTHTVPHPPVPYPDRTTALSYRHLPLLYQHPSIQPPCRTREIEREQYKPERTTPSPPPPRNPLCHAKQGIITAPNVIANRKKTIQSEGK
jgi:hypothetical protein